MRTRGRGTLVASLALGVLACGSDSPTGPQASEIRLNLVSLSLEQLDSVQLIPSVVDAAGRTVGELLVDLDRQFPGLRFRVVDEQGRVRKHLKVFVNSDSVRDLAHVVTDADEVVLMQALSGG